MDEYWLVQHTPDLIETGIKIKRTYIKMVCPDQTDVELNKENILNYFCLGRFGDKVAYVKGTAPCENWSIAPISKAVFDKHLPNKWKGHYVPSEGVTIKIMADGSFTTSDTITYIN